MKTTNFCKLGQPEGWVPSRYWSSTREGALVIFIAGFPPSFKQFYTYRFGGQVGCYSIRVSGINHLFFSKMV